MEPIPFNKAICLEDSMKCVEDAIRDNRLSGNGRQSCAANGLRTGSGLRRFL